MEDPLTFGLSARIRADLIHVFERYPEIERIMLRPCPTPDYA